MERVPATRRRTPEEVARDERICQQVASELPEILARNEAAPGHADLKDVQETKQLASLLRTERERQRIDLTEIARRTRYKLEDLELLESGLETNPPLAMLTRYARALGMQVLLVMRQGEPWRDPRKHEVPAEAQT